MAKPRKLGDKKQDRPIAIKSAERILQTGGIPNLLANVRYERVAERGCVEMSEVVMSMPVMIRQSSKASSVDAEEAKRVRLRGRDDGRRPWRTEEARAMRSTGFELSEAVVALDFEGAVENEAEHKI